MSELIRQAMAKAICDSSFAGKMFPWHTLHAGEREPFLVMADAALAALHEIVPPTGDDTAMARELVRTAVLMKRQYQDAGLCIARVFCRAHGFDTDEIEHEMRGNR